MLGVMLAAPAAKPRQQGGERENGGGGWAGGWAGRLALVAVPAASERDSGRQMCAGARARLGAPGRVSTPRARAPERDLCGAAAPRRARVALATRARLHGGACVGVSLCVHARARAGAALRRKPKEAEAGRARGSPRPAGHDRRRNETGGSSRGPPRGRRSNARVRACG